MEFENLNGSSEKIAIRNMGGNLVLLDYVNFIGVKRFLEKILNFNY